jgi:hypothetical protein
VAAAAGLGERAAVNRRQDHRSLPEIQEFAQNRAWRQVGSKLLTGR